MEFLSSLCSFIVTAIILIGIPVGVIWLIVAIVKRQSKKIPRNILVGCVVGIVVFSIIGGSAWSGTDDYTEYQAEKEEQERLDALANAEKEQKNNTLNNETSTQTEIETEIESEVETEVVETESEINVDELSEEEYKEMCMAIYDDDDTLKLEDRLEVGQLVKIDGKLFNEYKSLQVAAFGEWRNRLEDRYFKCGVLTKERSDSNSIYGERVYLVFDKEREWTTDDFELEQIVVVYGEVILKWDGVYIVPKYMELVVR